MKKMQVNEHKIPVCVHIHPGTVAIIDEIRGQHSRSAAVEAMLLEYLGLPDDMQVDSYTMSRGTEV